MTSQSFVFHSKSKNDELFLSNRWHTSCESGHSLSLSWFLLVINDRYICLSQFSVFLSRLDVIQLVSFFIKKTYITFVQFVIVSNSVSQSMVLKMPWAFVKACIVCYGVLTNSECAYCLLSLYTKILALSVNTHVILDINCYPR